MTVYCVLMFRTITWFGIWLLYVGKRGKQEAFRRCFLKSFLRMLLLCKIQKKAAYTQSLERFISTG